MTSEENGLKQRFGAKHITRFLGGVALSALVVSIPITYGSPADLNLAQIGLASLLVLSGGVLSSLWSEKFIDAVTRLLNSFAA
jgi:hypothetical protein